MTRIPSYLDFAVDYPFDDLPMCEDASLWVFAAGKAILAAAPNGEWVVDELWLDRYDEATRRAGSMRIGEDHPEYARVVAALERHDKRTRAITDWVIEELHNAVAERRGCDAYHERRDREAMGDL